MDATEITSSWKTLKEFLVKAVAGEIDKKELNSIDLEEVDNKGSTIMKDIGFDEFLPTYKKLSNYNILNKNVSYKIFDSLPKIWNIFYGATIDIAASECSRVVG